MTDSDETCAWHALPLPLMVHDDPRYGRLLYGRIVRGVVFRWSVDLGPWSTHWVLLPVEIQLRIDFEMFLLGYYNPVEIFIQNSS
jgi:hypothetical protein